MQTATGNIQTSSKTSISKLVHDYLNYLIPLIQAIDVSEVEQVVSYLCSVREQGGTIYIMGNGGSAANASHFANDLGKATKKLAQPPMRVLSLTDNVSWLSALANDEGYENVFVGQLDNYLRSDDVVIVISASGNSTNLVRAVELAKSRGAATIGILGFDGGILYRMVDMTLFVPSLPNCYGPVEDLHMILQHVISTCLAEL